MALTGRVFALVTGAGSGLGAAACGQLAAVAADGSCFVLTGRREEKLKGTEEVVKEQRRGIEVYRIVHDMADCSTIREKFNLDKILAGKSFDAAFVMHNHGTLGDVQSAALDADDSAAFSRFLDVNVTAMVVLNSIVLKQLLKDETTVKGPIFVVQTSTLLAVKAMPGFSWYSTAKAGRDAFIRALAVENPKKLRALNYAPGPVQTDMYRQLCDDQSGLYHKGTRDAFKGALNAGTVLTPKQTMDKLIKLLCDNTFESGAHVDYFDIP